MHSHDSILSSQHPLRWPKLRRMKRTLRLMHSHQISISISLSEDRHRPDNQCVFGALSYLYISPTALTLTNGVHLWPCPDNLRLNHIPCRIVSNQPTGELSKQVPGGWNSHSTMRKPERAHFISRKGSTIFSYRYCVCRMPFICLFDRGSTFIEH